MNHPLLQVPEFTGRPLDVEVEWQTQEQVGIGYTPASISSERWSKRDGGLLPLLIHDQHDQASMNEPQTTLFLGKSKEVNMPRAAKNAGDKPAPKKKKASAYKMPDPLPLGEVLTDMRKKQWSLGPSVGKGGFGEIYLAHENKDGRTQGQASHVIKIEPHENGPLFCELHFYQRAAKPELITGWKKEHNMKHLGVPAYIGSGQHEHGNTKYRFMVMDLFGEDLWNLFMKNGKRFSPKLVYSIGLQLVDALEYLHAQGYVHADIKGSNILLGHGPKAKDQVFLVDYGLASRYTPGGNHREYKEDPKKAHDGTLEYTSIGAHLGVVPARRQDFEILGYNLVQWLAGSLPWANITKETEVQAQKQKHSKNRVAFLQSTFSSTSYSAELLEYFKYVDQIGYKDEPNYDKIRDIFKRGITSSGEKCDGRLNFGAVPNGPAKTVATPRRRSPQKSPGKKARSSSAEQSVKPGKRNSDSLDQGDKPVRKKNKRTVDDLGTSSSSDVKSPSPQRKKPSDTEDGDLSPKRGSKQKVPAILAGVRKSPRTKKPVDYKNQLDAKTLKRLQKKDAVAIATQTSPGLKGLRVNRKKKAGK